MFPLSTKGQYSTLYERIQELPGNGGETLEFRRVDDRSAAIVPLESNCYYGRGKPGVREL